MHIIIVLALILVVIMVKPTFLVGLLLGALLAGVGYFLGQYHPLTGGFLISIAEPFSPARTELAIGYAIVGGVIGFLLGLILIRRQEK